MTDIKNNPILGGLLKTIAGIADTPKGASAAGAQKI